jgi:hypothetical protein
LEIEIDLEAMRAACEAGYVSVAEYAGTRERAGAIAVQRRQGAAMSIVVDNVGLDRTVFPPQRRRL